MENKLKALFGFQRFESNPDLQKVIDSTHARYAMRQLNFDEMESIAAAGVSELKRNKDTGPEQG